MSHRIAAVIPKNAIGVKKRLHFLQTQSLGHSFVEAGWTNPHVRKSTLRFVQPASPRTGLKSCVCSRKMSLLRSPNAFFGVITAITGDRVMIESKTMEKISTRLKLSENITLELLQLVLRDPSDIFLERTSETRRHYFFYRREIAGYVVAVVKRILSGAFLCTMHLTGQRMRNKHKILERVK